VRWVTKSGGTPWVFPARGRKPQVIWLLSLLRRLSAPGSARADVPAEVASEDPPSDLQTLESPVLQPPAEAELLDYAEARRRVRQTELGLDDRALASVQDRAHEQIVAAALAAIGDPAAQKNYFPRRPNLLPELMHAINDESMSVRQLVAIVARDPALVGSLLKVANSSFYRISPQPIESIERAIVVLGNDGLRSVTAAALMQPIFQVSRAGAAPRFPELVWEHAIRSAHAAIPHAALVEKANPFSAELLSLISGLAEIALFRAVIEHCAPSSEQEEVDPLVIASILDADSAAFAWHIGADWRLSAEMLAALEEQMASSEPKTPLGRSLRFGRHAGALAVLHTNSIISDGSVRASLPPSGLSSSHLEVMLTRLLRPHDDPRMKAKAAAA
jgi:HD-like signal output (HDOD) protein